MEQQLTQKEERHPIRMWICMDYWATDKELAALLKANGRDGGTMISAALASGQMEFNGDAEMSCTAVDVYNEDNGTAFASDDYAWYNPDL